jgi:hypothetical protein
MCPVSHYSTLPLFLPSLLDSNSWLLTSDSSPLSPQSETGNPPEGWESEGQIRNPKLPPYALCHPSFQPSTIPPFLPPLLASVYSLLNPQFAIRNPQLPPYAPCSMLYAFFSWPLTTRYSPLNPKSTIPNPQFNLLSPRL